MLTLEVISMAWRSLGANKLRSALTISGITVGIFSVISVMTTISALSSSIETGLSFLGADIFQFAKYPGTVNAFGDQRFKNRRNIDYETYLTFARLVGDRVELITPKVFDANVQAVFGNRKTNPNLEVCGTNQGFIVSNNFSIATGRNLTTNDVELARNVCVIGKSAIDRLFPEGGAVGKMIRLDGRTYEVVGTFAPKGEAFGANQDNEVIIPITKFFENYGSKNRTVNVAVQARNQLVYEKTLGYAIGAFRKARGLRPEDPNDFEIYSNDSLASAFRDIAGMVRIGAFVISTIALVAAGVGIMNIMLVSVAERTKEIGVRKSLGARQRDIRLQFLLEALFLSLLGAFSGIILGVAAGNGFAAFVKAQLVFPWGWSIAGVLACSAIGIIFGLYPAHKAASLDPIEALRYE
jgi:putative ABC transport system permease protein